MIVSGPRETPRVSRGKLVVASALARGWFLPAGVLQAMSLNTTNSGAARADSRVMTEEQIAAQLIAERERLEQAADLAQPPIRHFRRPEERSFTAEERPRVTILFGGLTWKHEKLIQAVFHGSGYRCETLPNPSLAAYHLGRGFGNPGQCNPAYFTVGNLVQYLRGLEARGLS